MLAQMVLAAGPVLHQMEARAAYTTLGQCLKRLGLERGVYVRDATGRSPQIGDGIENDAVVIPVGGWADENGSAEARDSLHVTVVLDGRGRRRVPALIVVRKNIGRAEDMGMRVASSFWNSPAWRPSIGIRRQADRQRRTRHTDLAVWQVLTLSSRLVRDQR